MSELNKIFDVKSRQARRDILDKFDLSKEDKNKVLNKIDSAGGTSGEGGNDAFDIRYVDLRGISNKRARMIISCYSNYQVYYNRLQSKVVTGCIAANTLYGLSVDDLPFHSTYTMACLLNVGMIVENNVSLRDAVLNAFDVDIEMLPKLTKEEFLNLGANDYSDWIYNDTNQPFYD